MPEFPVATVVFPLGNPLLLVGLVTAEVPIGFVVFQEKFMVQLLLSESITQEVEAGVRVPDIIGGGVTVTVTVSYTLAPILFVHSIRKV